MFWSSTFWSKKRRSHKTSANSVEKLNMSKSRFLKNKAESLIKEIPTMSKILEESPQMQGAYMMLQKKEPHIITAGESTIGARREQQDSYFVTPSTDISPFKIKRTFAIVCDGMGGLEAGDRASITAVETMKLAVSKLPTKNVDIPHFYREMLENVDYEINHWEDLKTNRGAGTTLSSVLIENKRLYWANVGDSSIFMIQDGKIKKITREHNYMLKLSELVAEGKITQYEADTDPQKDALISYLGMGGVSCMDVTSKPYLLKNGDMLLLCSDGVTNTLTEKELLHIVSENSDNIYACCEKIIESVNNKNLETQDNATVVIVQYVE